MAAYAGSAIARSNPLKTGVQATKLAIAAFIIPYVFALNPALLVIPASGPLEIITVTITAFAGMFGVAIAVEGYMYANVNPILRLVALAGGLMLIIPGIVTDIGGVALIAIVIFLQKARAKKLEHAHHTDFSAE